MSNSILFEQQYNAHHILPIMDVSPSFPLSDRTSAVVDTAEDDFMSIALSNKYTTGNSPYPLSALNSESSNLFYLGNNTIGTMHGCHLIDDSYINIQYKLTPIKPYAILIRTPQTLPRWVDKIIILGYKLRPDGSEYGYATIGSIVGVSAAATQQSGIFYYAPDGGQDYYDGFRVYVGKDKNSSYASPAIGTFKILGQPREWNNQINTAYNTHLLNLFAYAGDNASAALGRINCITPAEPFPMESI